MKHLVSAIIGSAVLFVAGAHAATINVGGQCSIFRAIVSANLDSSPQGFCRPGRGADTINLPANRVFGLTQVNNTTYGPSGLPVIRSAITINGNKSTIKRAPKAPAFGIFTVVSGGVLSIRDVIITGAQPGCAPICGGAAIHVRNTPGSSLLPGYLRLDRVSVTGNGGTGIASLNASQLYISRSSIMFNNGVGIQALSNFGNLFVLTSTVAHNGAGIGVSSTTAQIDASTIAYNSEVGIRADGRSNLDGAIDVSQSLIVGNGVDIDAQSGGSIVSTGWNITNKVRVDTMRGAVYVQDPTDVRTRVSAPFIVSIAPTSQGVLPLVQDSLAIDAKSDGLGCSPTDQRGVKRPQDGNGDGGAACDIGAYELIPATPVAVIQPPQAAPIAAPEQNPIAPTPSAVTAPPVVSEPTEPAPIEERPAPL